MMQICLAVLMVATLTLTATARTRKLYPVDEGAKVKATFPNPGDIKEGEALGWVKVVVPDGRNGYVAQRYVRSPTDYRVGFQRIRGKWLITDFVAGD